MVTVAFNNESGIGTPWQIRGFSGAASGVVIASGFASSGTSVRHQVSGYDSYQFLAYPGNVTYPSLPIQGDTQISVVFAATE